MRYHILTFIFLSFRGLCIFIFLFLGGKKDLKKTLIDNEKFLQFWLPEPASFGRLGISRWLVK